MLTLTGLCHGYHAETRQFGEKSFTDHLLLLEVEQLNQYGITENKTVKVKIGKGLMEQGIQHIWNQNKGKAVSVPVFVSAWASKAGNAGYDLYLSGDGKPVPLQLATAKPVAAAS